MRGGHEPRWPETHRTGEERPRDLGWAYENILLKSCPAAKSCPALCERMLCSTPASSVPHHLPELAQTHVHWVSDAIQPPHPLLPPSPRALNLPQHQALFQKVSSCIRWPKYRSFSFSISLSSEYSGLISFWIDRFELLAVQGTLKCLLQHFSLKASIFQRSAFFMVQISQCYMTPGKKHCLDYMDLCRQSANSAC